MVRLYIAVVVIMFQLLTSLAQTPPTITSQPANASAISGYSVLFSTVASGSPQLAYQWQFNGTNISNSIITRIANNVSLSQPWRVVPDASCNLLIVDHGNNKIRKLSTNGTASTVAGGGFTTPNNGVVATNALISNPYAVAADSSNNVYVAYNTVVFKVRADGIISMVAGKNSNAGSSGDGGQSTNALLFSPYDLAFDSLGNLFIADNGANRVRRVGTNGVISTVAGGGAGGDGGQATNASLSSPKCITIDSSGSLFIGEAGAHRIRKVDGSSGIITTLAGNGVAGTGGDGGSATNANLSSPSGIALDTFGNLYIADQNDTRIRRVSTNGIISTVAGKSGGCLNCGDGGPATNAGISTITGVAVDLGNNLLMAGENNNNVRVVTSSTYSTLFLYNVNRANAGDYTVIVTNMYGMDTSSVATLNILSPPSFMAQPANRLVMSGSDVSFSVSTSGTFPITYLWYSGLTNLLQSGTNNVLNLQGVGTNGAGQYFVVITNLYGSATSALAMLTVVSPIQPLAKVVQPGGNVSFDVTAVGTGPFRYQWQLNGTNLPNNIISTVVGNGTWGFSGDGDYATNASITLDSFAGVAFDLEGNLYIADTFNQRVRKVDTTGIITTVAGNGSYGYSGDGGPATNAVLYWPEGIALNSQGGLYISDRNNGRVRFVDTNGFISTIVGGGTNGNGYPATDASLSGPAGIALDSAGSLYIAELNGNRIRKVDGNNVITSFAGNGAMGHSGDGGPATNAVLFEPVGVGLDSAGNVYIAEVGNYIRRVGEQGTISSIAGNGSLGYSGDGGLATVATLNSPVASIVDRLGNKFISDQANHRIRKINTKGIITTIAGTGILAYSGDGGDAANAELANPAGLAIDGLGNLLFADFYNNRVRKISYLENADQQVLALANVTTNSSGNYAVIVSNPYGSITSSVAVLTVAYPPTIRALLGTNGQITFVWSAVSNNVYQLQYASNVASGVWLNLGSLISATNSIGSASDFIGPDTQRYYRIQQK